MFKNERMYGSNAHVTSINTNLEDSENIISILPFKVPNLNANLQSILKPISGLSPNVGVSLKGSVFPGSVPISKDLDITSIINENSSRNLNTSSDITGPDDSFLNGKTVVNYFVDLDKLIPKNDNDQKMTIAIKNFPNVKKNYYIEKIISLLLTRDGATQDFVWSTLNHDFVDNKWVFLKLTSNKSIGWFVNLATQLNILQNIEIKIDASFDEQILKSQESVIAESVKSTISKEIEGIIKHETSEAINRDEDEELSFFKTYKVEPSELIDIPTDSKASVTRDIIKFRTKVLKMEKERRNKEIELERKKAKLKMKKMLEEIKESNGEMVVDTDEKETELISKDSINDEEAYELSLEKEQDKIENTFLAKESQLLKIEENEKAKLIDSLQKSKSYESSLLEKKSNYMNEFKNFVDYGKYEISEYSYYRNHSDYVKRRQLRRSREEELDSKDREEEQLEISSMNKTNEFLSSFMSNQPSVAISTESNKPGVSVKVKVAVKDLSTEQLQQIKLKVESLIEEYLGVKEDELIDFVYNFVLSNEDKNELVDELSETLDDDAQIVVDALWEYIESFQ